MNRYILPESRVSWGNEGKVPIGKIAKREEVYKPIEGATYQKIQEDIERDMGLKYRTAYITEAKKDLGAADI